MATIGATPGGGVHRLALTDEDRQARDLLVQWFTALGLSVTIDEMGNIFGKRGGRQDALPPVVAGSHMDSQPLGGRFDGILGVMGALEAVRTLCENGIETVRPLVIANWTNEEGSRFSPAMMGSGVWTGKLDRDWIYERADIAGKLFGDELERIGYRGALSARRSPVHAYLEYHIEQGPILEREGQEIGIPRGIVGIRWLDVFLEGTANQVGPTPMAGRNDALAAAAEMILAVQGLPERMGEDLVATVGEIHSSPNSRNIIPDRVRFTVDIRSWEDAHRRSAEGELRDELDRIARKHGCSIRLDDIWEVDRMPFNGRVVELVSKTAEALGIPPFSMLSGAGHDAGYMSLVAPTAMVFVPSIGGRSHVECEKTHWDDCEAGANVLLHSMLQLANEP